MYDCVHGWYHHRATCDPDRKMWVLTFLYWAEMISRWYATLCLLHTESARFQCISLTDAPKIENGSKCSISEHLSTCVCISHGVPLPIITWPLGLTSQDYNMTTSVSDDTVTSTITTSAALLRGADTVMCLSKNELGQANMTLTVNFTKRGEEGKCLQ